MGQIMGISKTQEIEPLINASIFVIVENERGEILLRKCLDTDHWELPGGVHLNEEPGLHLAQFSPYRKFDDTVIYMAKSYFGHLKTRSVGLNELRFFSLYDLPLAFQETSKLIVDAYAADHFWIGG
jgi:hypothetical protein